MATARVPCRTSADLCFGSQCNFNGKRVNVVQVGLGTNSTFLHNLGGKWDEWDRGIAWLLTAVSEKRPWRITGVGVEPVEEHVASLSVGSMKWLPHVAIAQVALGDENRKGESIHVLTKRARDAILLQALPHARDDLRQDLCYLDNMSSVRREHPCFAIHQKWIEYWYGVEVNMDRSQTDVWTWGSLTAELNFSSCELLIVDTEGHDAAVLRSLVAYCNGKREDGRTKWPDVIQFETMSHCDQVEGEGTEWHTVRTLVDAGYVLVHYSHYNTQLAHSFALDNRERVRRWAGQLQCTDCAGTHCFPFSSNGAHMRCCWCHDACALDAWWSS